MENTAITIGAMFYGITAFISAYIAGFTELTPATNWKGKYITYYGMFNIAFWAIITLFLVIRKLGTLLLV